MTTINHDPILVSVISNRLDSITKEMGKTMLRTSRSPIFSEARDFVTAIFDRQVASDCSNSLHSGARRCFALGVAINCGNI